MCNVFTYINRNRNGLIIQFEEGVNDKNENKYAKRNENHEYKWNQQNKNGQIYKENGQI